MTHSYSSVILMEEATEHTYPRGTDPISDKWVPIVGTGTNFFDINVGTSLTTFYSPTSGSFDPITGLMTVGFGTSTQPQKRTVCKT